MCILAPYKFVGILNMFDICPDFVFPIFEKDNIFFFEDANEESGRIEDFVPVKEDAIRLIKHVEDFKLSKDLNNSFFIGSPALVAFQLSNSYLQVGTIEELKNFLVTYETDDAFLNNQIQVFFETWQ